MPAVANVTGEAIYGDPEWEPPMWAPYLEAQVGCYLEAQVSYHLLSRCTDQPAFIRTTLLKEHLSG